MNNTLASMPLIVSWNVNSIKSRLEHLQKFISEHKPDVILLQEIKCETDNFPNLEIEELGYNIAARGQKSYNGVAILSKSPIEDVNYNGVINDEFSHEARYIEGLTTINNICMRVASVYVPQGNEVGSEKFKFKLRFYEHLKEHYAKLIANDEIFIAGGDYNVAPDNIDVYSPKYLEGSLGFHIDERKGFRKIINIGMKDSFRLVHPDIQEYSWWDYRSGGWQHNKGMRIDQILVSPQACNHLTTAGIFKDVRGWEKASDHTPIYCVLEKE